MNSALDDHLAALAARFDDRSPLPRAAEGTERWRDAHLYIPHDDLREALRVAVLLQRPLLLTGDPGSGKTTAAYWAAQRLGMATADLVTDTIRSDATAARLRYEFDAVRYFREAQVSHVTGGEWRDDRRAFIRPGPLWKAFKGATTRTVGLLLDEIDKAPRDLPNDLLEELDSYHFTVPELPEGHEDHRVDARAQGATGLLALVVVTSNGERQLPDAFLRRCVHHHVEFDRDLIERIVSLRITAGDIRIDRSLVGTAIDRFVQLQRRDGLRHRPGLAEFLLWARMLGHATDLSASKLKELDLSKLPYLGTLIKDAHDRRGLGAP